MSNTGTQPRQTQKILDPRKMDSIALKVAICPPDLHMLQRVMKGESVDATFIIQGYIAEGLRNRGHELTFLGPYHSEGLVYAGDISHLEPARRTWTDSFLFHVFHKLVWKVQRLIGIPYLNVFSNLALMDACMQYFPGNKLVYERNSMYRFGVAMACRRLGMPFILYFEADDILEHDIMNKPIVGLQRVQADRAIRYNLKAADHVICVSEPLKAHLIKKWNVPGEKIVVFPNVADVRRFHPDPDSRNIVRDSLGIGSSPLVIFVGNFYEWHDVKALLNAFVKLLGVYPDARLLLVGDGEKRQSMTQLAVSLGIDQAVIFTGMVAHSDVPRYMAAADVAVVPYPDLKQDIWLSPLKLFEYMATGNAIIASNVGQLSDWIVNEQNGLLVPPGDVSALAAGMERLLGDPALRSRLGQHAREDAEKKHSWDRYLSDLESLFSSVTGKGKH